MASSKPYTSELADWVEKKEQAAPRKKDRASVAFLAVRDQVESAITAGYSKMTIWEHMKETGRFPFRYESFLHHVAKHIPAARRPKRTSPKPTEPSAAEAPRKGFHYNPTPRKEELF